MMTSRSRKRAGEPSTKRRKRETAPSDFLFKPLTAADFMEKLIGALSGASASDTFVGANYIVLLSTRLRELRFEIERGIEEARDDFAQLEARLIAMLRDGTVSEDLLEGILQAMLAAEMKPSDQLREAIAQRIDSALRSASVGEPDAEATVAALLEIAGSEPFGLAQALVHVTEAVPREARAAMVDVMLRSEVAAARDAAALLFLDQDAAVRSFTHQQLLDAAHSLTPATIRRLVTTRSWLPSDERALLDEAVRRARAAGTDCASAEQRQPAQLWASSIDGAGAQSIFCIAPEGRRRRVASVLVKHAYGIRDAWCTPPLPQREAAAMLAEMRAAVPVRQVSQSYLDATIAQFLAEGTIAGTVPPLGLLQAQEILGGEAWRPAEDNWSDALDRLVSSMSDALLERDAVERTLRMSLSWAASSGLVESWFEDDDETRQTARRARRESNEAVTARVLERIVLPRREKWAELFLRTSLWLREGEAAPSWAHFAILSRELAAGCDVTAVPLLHQIAAATVEVANSKGMSRVF